MDGGNDEIAYESLQRHRFLFLLNGVSRDRYTETGVTKRSENGGYHVNARTMKDLALFYHHR